MSRDGFKWLGIIHHSTWLLLHGDCFRQRQQVRQKAKTLPVPFNAVNTEPAVCGDANHKGK
jgi:hypothetical protein